MRILVLIIPLILMTTNAFGQSDTINSAYFSRLQEILSKDSLIKDYRYVCNKFKSGKIKEQHMYVKYKTDSIERFWRIGKCYHYYENGNLESTTDVDIILKKHVGKSVNLDINGDTTSATFWGNQNGKVMLVFTVFSVDNLGRIYEMYPDKYIDVTYKKGKRKKAVITLCNGQYCYTSSKIYYKKDGTIDRIEDFNDNSK
jgi:hypothetical protein